MKTSDFLRQHDARNSVALWALSVSKNMADVWDAMIEQNRHEWLLWTATRPGVFPDSTLRRLACRCVRETPLHDGRTVWNLIADERSRKAIEVAERYADGHASEAELEAACVAARAAADAAAFAAANIAADADAWSAAAYFAALANSDAAYSAAYAADSARSAARAADAAAVWAADAAAAWAAEAADAAAYTAARSAQMKMVATVGNPFRKEK